jgi:hypothetical protein
VQESNSVALEAKPQTLTPAGSHGPAEMLYLAVSQGADLEKISKLMDLQERWQKNEARQAFIQAMSDFKSHAIVVLKDKINPQYNSRYVSLGNLVATVTPFLSQNRLSVHWDVDQSAGIKVTAIIRHALGHSESVSMVVPPDKSGSKNPIQEIKSAITYAKACTFESICGLASTDASASDDGNAAGDSTRYTELPERLEWIENCATDVELEKVFKAAYKEARDKKDSSAMQSLVAAKDKRKREIRSAA